MMGASRFLPSGALLAAIVACRTHSPDPSSGSASPEAGAEAAADGEARVEAAPIDSGQEAGPDPRCSSAAYEAGIREGESALAAQSYARAVAGFRRAIVARPLDTKARAKLGEARRLAGDLDAADRELRLGAELARDDAELAAEIWTSRGRVAETQKQPEIARAAFAVADRRKSTPETRARIVDKSRCPVAVVEGEAEPLEIVVGFQGLDAALTPQIAASFSAAREQLSVKPSTEREAKARVCRDYTGNGKDACAGPSPWTITTSVNGNAMRTSVARIFPLARRRFAIVRSVEGDGGPTAGGASTDARLAGDRLLVVEITREAYFVTEDSACVAASDKELVERGGIGYGDVQSLTTSRWTVYDVSDGHALVHGVAWSTDRVWSAEPLLQLTPTALVINDGACAKPVPLRVALGPR